MRPGAVSWRLLLMCTCICSMDLAVTQTNAHGFGLGDADGCLTSFAVDNCPAFWAALQSLPSNDQGKVIAISGLMNCSSFGGKDIELWGRTIVTGCGPQCTVPVLDMGGLEGKILLTEGASLEFHGVVVLQDRLQLTTARGVIMPALALQGENTVRYGVSVLVASHCAYADLQSLGRSKPKNSKGAGRKMKKEQGGLDGDVETDFTINNATVDVGTNGAGLGKAGDAQVELVGATGHGLLDKLGVVQSCETVVLCHLGTSMGALARRLQAIQESDCGSFNTCGQVGHHSLAADLSLDAGRAPAAERLTGGDDDSSSGRVAIAVSTTVAIIVLLLAATVFSSYIVNKRRRKMRVEPALPTPPPQDPARQEEPKLKPLKQDIVPHSREGTHQQEKTHCSRIEGREESFPLRESDWSMLDLRDVEFKELIGKGGFGKVYKARYRGEVLAVKMISHEDVSNDAGSQPLEAYFSQSIKHRHVVRTYLHNTHKRNCSEAICVTPMSGRSEADWLSCIGSVNEMELGDFRTWLIMEYCDRGTLRQAIDEGNRFGGFGGDCAIKRERLVLSCAWDITSAMAYLHSLDIIHGDLKAHNILLQSCKLDGRGFICKVADFGLSRSSRARSYIQTNTFGTVSHMPPELLSDGILTPATDVYSFGMILFEMLSGEAPFSSLKYTEIVMGVVAGTRPTIPSHCPPAMALLIRDCWHKDYRLRPTFREIVDRLDSIIDHAMCPVDGKQDPLLLKGDVGARPQEQPPVPSFLTHSQSISTHSACIVDTAFSIPLGEEPEGTYTARDSTFSSEQETEDGDSGAEGYLSARAFQ